VVCKRGRLIVFSLFFPTLRYIATTLHSRGVVVNLSRNFIWARLFAELPRFFLFTFQAHTRIFWLPCILQMHSFYKMKYIMHTLETGTMLKTSILMIATKITSAVSSISFFFFRSFVASNITHKTWFLAVSRFDFRPVIDDKCKEDWNVTSFSQ